VSEEGDEPHLKTGFRSHINADGCRNKTGGSMAQRGKDPQRKTRVETRGTEAGNSITKNKMEMKKVTEWMKKENKVFSVIGGERFTNGDVVYTHAGLLLFLAAIGIVGALVQ
jgi:hypothetical protein